MDRSEAIKQAILEVPWILYGTEKDGARDGCPADLPFGDGSPFMRAGSPPRVNCCGVASWVYFRHLAILGTLGPPLLDLAKAKLLRKYFNVVGWEKYPERLRGGPQGLVDLGLGSFVPLEEAQLGDVLQIQWDPEKDPTLGHAMIVTQYDPDFRGAPAIWAFSANTSVPKYDPPYGWARGHLPRERGSQHDYFRIASHPERKFWVARPTEPT